MSTSPTAPAACGADILVTGRVKTYPGGGVEVMACTEAVFKPEGWELRKRASRVKDVSPSGDSGIEPDITKGNQSTDSNPANRERAMRRARAQVRDLALCTPFKWFVTLTLDRQRVDRHDMGEITRHLNHWLDNQVRRRGLSYVLVPERHKDGAIHFHGFFNDALPVVDSGTVSLPGVKAPRRPRSERQRANWLQAGGHTVYNLPGWGWGFSTAIELYGDYNKAVSYVCKYIGKDGEKPGGRWFYSGGKLGRPQVTYEDISFREVEALDNAIVFAPDGSGKAFAMARVFPEYWTGEELKKEVEKLRKLVENGTIWDSMLYYCREAERDRRRIRALEAAEKFGRLTDSGLSTTAETFSAAVDAQQVSIEDYLKKLGGGG